ncbi:MAG: proton-conducting transporter transmembrane domain-containing protein, partial [Isosphaeraceae bacterium]
MLTMEHVMTVLGAIVIASPVLLVFILGISSLLDCKLSEQTTTTVLQAGTVSGLLAALAVLLAMLILGTRHVPIELGDWVVIPGQYHFSIKFVFDRLSVPMAILSFTLSGTIGAFASRYMHRDAGYNRFFVLYTLFVLGMVATSLAGTIETLFAGWELVGLSSALLVAFFQERRNPARNGLWVWTIYRFSDAALLLAAVAMHHLRGEGDFDKLLGTGLWPEIVPSLTSHQGLLVGLLVLVAAAGKSA